MSKDGIYAALPKDRDIQICQATNGYLCMMNQVLYPIEKIEWCIYALFERNYSKIGEYCVVDTKVRRANIAEFGWIHVGCQSTQGRKDSS